MSTPIDGYTLYDLLGAEATDDTAAAAYFPGDKFSMTPGYNVVHDETACVSALRDAIRFTDLRVGSDPTIQVGDATSPGAGRPGQITMSASAQVLGDVGPFYARDLPNVGIVLLTSATGKGPTVFFARDGRGYEVLVEGLPVELQLPGGLISPAKDDDDHDGDANEFDPGDDDSVAVVKFPTQPSVIRTHIRLHLTPDGDVIVEPQTPINIDTAKFSNLPVTALHDLLIIPSPRRRDRYEWARNDLTPLLPGTPPGAFGLRSILFDLAKAPFADLTNRFKDSNSVTAANIELVLEDVVIPASGFGFPLPVHGTFGIRRKITDRTSIEQAYSLANAPVKVRIYSRDGQADNDHTGLYLVVNQLEFRTGSTVADSDSPPVLEFQAQLDWQNAATAAAAADAAAASAAAAAHAQADASAAAAAADPTDARAAALAAAAADVAAAADLIAAAAAAADAANAAKGGTVGITDDWVLQLGLNLGVDSPLHIMTIADSDIRINTITGGLRLTTLDDPAHAWQALVDISVRDVSDPTETHAFTITTLTGKPLDMILRGIGYSFGHSQLGQSIAAPEGVQLLFGGTVRLIVEELGFVEEPAGGTYFSFSGGVGWGAAGAQSASASSSRTDTAASGSAIRFRRLRFLTSDTPSAPPVKIDGLFLDLHHGSLKIAGFGYITDDTESGFRYREFGFGAQVAFTLMGDNLSVAAEFLKGTSTEIQTSTDPANPPHSFGYLLASLQLSYLPAGSFTLYAIRALFANNMQPALDPAGEGALSMQLYQWHKDHDGAIDMPRSRNLADWQPVEHSFAVGIAVGFSFTATGQVFHFGIFILVAEANPSMRILVVGELFLMKNPDAIGVLAIDYDVDTGKFGVLAGINFGLDKFANAGAVLGWAGAIKLTGTVFFGNQPATLAIGQLSDQRSWMGITLSSQWLKLKARIAACLQIVDGGPKGFGALASFTGGDDWGIGKFQVYGSIGFIWGAWKTGSDTTGIHTWAQAGFKMSVFYVFSVGMDIGVDVTHLKSPWYVTLTAQIHIDTPWFLPDVTFQISKTWNHCDPFDGPLVTPPLSGGEVHGPRPTIASAPMHVPALTDGNGDPTRLYSFNQLAAVTGADPSTVVVPDDLQKVPVDADIAITFTNPLANDAAIATQSYPVTDDPGIQKVQDLTVRYALKSVQIARRPRFGPGAGTWSDLVAAVDTALDLTGGASVHATPAVSFAWDADSRADGVLSPVRLLINCRTPYSVIIGSSQNDEEALGNDDGFPCCQLDPIKGFQIPWHDLSWAAASAGLRLPTTEPFSGNGGRWSWTAAPATMTGIGAYAGRVVALDLLDTNTLRGCVDLHDPAVTFTAQLLPLSARITCTLTAYHGLTVLATQTVTAPAGGTPVTLSGTVTTPITRITLHAQRTAVTPPTAHAAAENPWGALGVPAVMVADLRYQSLTDVLSVMGRRQRCRNSGTTTAVGGAGKLAFLPNCDYAVIPTIEVTVGHASAGTKTLSISEPSFFRTKGLLGLNASPNVGDELKPYVAASYPPGRSVPLYRTEPVALAFTEEMSSLLPVDRVAAPGDPPEKAQLMRLALSVDRVASTDGRLRLTSPGPDWLTSAPSGSPPPIRPPFGNGLHTRTAVRTAASQDVKVQRFESVAGAAGCAHQTLHSSQVFLHDPIAADGTPGAWEAKASMRATLRTEDGPYTERNTFLPNDLSVFTYLSDTGAEPSWTLTDGTLVGPGTGRHYATMGDPDWNYYQISTTVDPAGGNAGIAIGVSGTSPVQQALLAVLDHSDLVLIRRTGGTDLEIARASLPTGDGAIDLHVTAFDDVIRASVGGVVIEGDRGPVRQGRAALVSDGTAVFSRLLVESLDIYQIEFVTSRYLTFADHIAGRDPTIYQHPSDSMGAPPASSPAATLAARSADIAGAMTAAADPQQRQQLFARILSNIGLPQLDRCDRLTMTRLTDPTGTTALLLESPEPLSFLHDVTLNLTHKTWRRLPHPVQNGAHTAIGAALAQIQVGDAGLEAPAAAAHLLFTNKVQIVLISSAAPDLEMTLYEVPPTPTAGPVALVARASYDATLAAQAGLSAVSHRPVGTLIAIRADHSVAATATVATRSEIPVAATLLTDGIETSTLAIFPTPLSSGTYSAKLSFNRTRWVTTVADPNGVYQDAVTVKLGL